MPKTPRSRAEPRESNIRVIVNRSTEAIDFDAWCASYVRDLIAADRAKQRHEQEAA